MKKNKNNKLFISMIIFIISFSFLLLLFFKVDPDYFWHVKAGEYMVKNGIIHTDVFSWFVSGKYWMCHEWLFDVIIYGMKVIFGEIHVIIYSFVCVVGLLLILFLTNKDYYMKNIPYTLVYYFFFFLLIIRYLQARPHMISFSLFALMIYVLYDLYKNQDSKKIYFLPIISIIWANVHGGSSNLPYLFCLLFLIGGLFSFKCKKIEAERMSNKQLIKYLVVMILCLLGVLVNIHGVLMFIYPYQNMMNQVMLQNIMEWQSTSFNEISHYTYLLFLVFLIFTMLFSDKKIKFMDLLLLGVVMYLGLKSIRFWMYTYLVMSYVIFDYVPKRSIDKGTIAGIGIMSTAFILLTLININSIINIDYSYSFDSKDISVIKKGNPKRLYNMYDYGGELIYNGIPVFIDGRADLYSPYNYKDYLDISVLHNDYVELIDKYDFDYFLVDEKYPISTYLKYNDNYKLIYKNKKILMYKKIVN